MKVTILGANAALPTEGRSPSAQVLNTGKYHFLIDCSEGTQTRMLQHHISKSKIDHICISHMHGDHVMGLVPLINSFSLAGRKRTLHLYGPEVLEEFVMTVIRLTGSHLDFPIAFHTVDPELPKLLFENHALEMYSFPLKHRIPTTGFLFREKELAFNIRREKITELNLSIDDIKRIKAGEDFTTPDGTLIPNAELVYTRHSPLSYAYCSDTQYMPVLSLYLKEVSAVYHEATFLHDMVEQAEKTMHSTALQAGTLARDAQIGKLIIGHYSSRYGDLNVLLDEARSVFPNTVLAIEGAEIEV